MYISAVILFIFGFITFCDSKVILNLRIYNYENENDVKHDGFKCESFHWLNDFCDPMFSICVTSKTKCDIFSHDITHWKNKKYINNVLMRAITLEHIQRSFTIEVKIDDHDKVDGHDHIAVFTLLIQVTQLNHNFAALMNVKPSGMSVKLRASILMRCAENYYGENCDLFCQPKLFNYNCDPKTGNRICTVVCGLYGACGWQQKSDEYTCQCYKGWTGEQCQFSNFDSCATLNCNKKCNETKSIRYCSCIIGPYVKMCQDRIPVTFTPITSKSITLTLKTASTRMSTIKYKSLTSNSTYFKYTSKGSQKQNTPLSESQSTQRVVIHYAGERDKWKDDRPTIKESVFSLTTVIIICLLLLLCICVISLSIVIRSWRTKEKSKTNGFIQSFYSQRPLPPVVYTPRSNNAVQSPMIHSTLRSNNIIQGSMNSSTPNSIQLYKPKYDDMCTEQSDCNYAAPLIKFDDDRHIDQDPYEEPIVNDTDNLTLETEMFDDQDNISGEYEIPFKIVL